MHPGPEFVDHLLVEFADAPARGPGLAGHEHAEQAAVRDRAAAGDRDDSRVAAALDRVGHPVPDDPRLEFGEFVGRVGAGEHPEHAFEDLAGERLVRRRAGDRREEVVDGPAVHHGHGHELLGQDIERVARDLGRLDGAFVHPPGDDGAFEQVAAVLREDDALARGPDLVAGPPDALEAASDAGRALDLDDEVDGTHVDPEFQAGGRDERGEPAGLELLLDLEALLAGDAAVVGPDEFLAGEFVEALGEPLAQPTAVGEDDRAAVAADELEDPRVDRRPDAVAPVAGLVAGPPGWSSGGRSSPMRRHVVDRDDDLEVERLAGAGVDDGDVAIRADAAEEPGDRLERALRGRQADPLHRPGAGSVGRAERLEPFEAEGEVGAALGPGDRVDLVDDHVPRRSRRTSRAALVSIR